MDLLKYEINLWQQGIEHIAGVDEAGRGPLAGPLVVAAVILDRNKLFEQGIRNNDVISGLYSEINDSKLINPKKREKLYYFILDEAICYSITEIDDKRIDEWGIAKATQFGFKDVISKLITQPSHILTDFFKIKDFDKKLQTNITRGDSVSISIAAASILAKVHRDRLMVRYHKQYPEYGFDKNKGYGTKCHREALKTYGPCEIHRQSFKYSVD